MSDSHGKDIDLRKTTVKIKGQRPKGSRISAGETTGDSVISSLLVHLSFVI